MKQIILISCFMMAAIMAKAFLPLHQWVKGSTNSASGSGCVGSNVVVDATGNVYTAGVFGGTVEFSPGVTLTVPSLYNSTGFITKHNS